MVTCMMTPLRNPRDFEHPAGLLDRLARAGIDYVIDPKFKVPPDIDADTLFRDWQASGRGFVDLLLDMTRARMDAVRLLMDGGAVGRVHLRARGGSTGSSTCTGTACCRTTAPTPTRCWSRGTATRRADRRAGRAAARRRHAADRLRPRLHADPREVPGQRVAAAAGTGCARREARRSPLYPLKRALGRLGVTRQRLGRVLGEQATSRLQLAAAHVDWARSEAYLDNPFGIRVNLQGRETLGRVTPGTFRRGARPDRRARCASSPTRTGAAAGRRHRWATISTPATRRARPLRRRLHLPRRSQLGRVRWRVRWRGLRADPPPHRRPPDRRRLRGVGRGGADAGRAGGPPVPHPGRFADPAASQRACGPGRSATAVSCPRSSPIPGSRSSIATGGGFRADGTPWCTARSRRRSCGNGCAPSATWRTTDGPPGDAQALQGLVET